MWNIRSVKVIPVVVGAIGSTSKKLRKCIEELGVIISTIILQKTALLGTTRRFRVWVRFVDTGLEGGI